MRCFIPSSTKSLRFLFTGIYLLLFHLALAQQPTLGWAKALGGTDGDQGRAIITDASGNVYTTGYFNGTSDFDPGTGTFNLTSSGLSDVFISKVDASGNFVWAKAIGGTSDDEGRAIKVDASGNVYTTGTFRGTVDFDPGAGTFNLTAGNTDFFISKLDATGNFVWAKAIGGTANDESYSLAIDASGNVVIAGFFNGTVDFDPGAGNFDLTSLGNKEIFISKLDASGNFVWARGIGSTSQDEIRSITIDASDHIIATGIFGGTVDFDPGAATFNLTASGGFDGFISKFEASGNFVWAAQLGGRSVPVGIAVDPSGNVFSAGHYDVAGDYDPGPATFTLTASGTYNTYISKLDASGNFVYAKRMGGAAYSSPLSMAVDPSGNVYTTGLFQGNFIGLTSSGSYSLFIAKHDASGNFAWSSGLDGSTYGAGWSITTDISANLFLTGAFLGSGDFDPGAGVFNVTSSSTNADVFVYKLLQPVGVPTITSFTPASGPVGTQVTITGTNFSATPASNAVAFNGTAATVTASTATSITTAVPSGASTGKITVVVSGNTATSTADFTVTAPTVITITSQPVNFSACPGDVATFSTAATGTTNITYRWQREDDGTFSDLSNGNGYSGVTTSTFSINTNQNNGIGVFRCRINGDGATQVITNEVSVTLNPTCGSNEPPVIEPTVSGVLAGGKLTIDLPELISDPDDNLDFMTLYTATSTEQGASALLDDFSFKLTLEYGNVQFIGTDYITVGICDLEDECVEIELAIEVGGDVTVYNALSLNGDQKNETFRIQSIDVLPDAVNNRVTILNRWGDVVFEIKDYNNTNRVFKGLGKNGQELPSGTYFYKIEFRGGRKTKTGYLSLKR